MPRPESPVDPHAGEVQLFAHELRLLREKAGCPPYRVLALRAHYAPATLARAAGGRELPSLAVTLAYVRACDGDEKQWESRWHEATAAAAPRTHGEPDQHLPPTPEVPAQPKEQRRAVRFRIRRSRLIMILAALFLLAGTMGAVVVNAGTDSPPPGKPRPGKTEMLDIHATADGTVRAWSNTGGFPGWPWSDPVHMILGKVDPALARFADLNGDGFDELVRIAADGTITAWLNDKGFPDRPWYASVIVGKGSTDPADIQFADLDGDGRDELITIEEVVRAWPNTGEFPKWPWSDPVSLGQAPARHTCFADLDGDAKAELITWDTTSGTQIQARPNTGAFPAHPWSTAVDLGPSHADPARVRFADLDGDGFDELISLHTDGTTSAWWNDRTFPDQPWHTSVVIGKDWHQDPASYHFANLTSNESTH